jgi:hypothetical protein
MYLYVRARRNAWTKDGEIRLGMHHLLSIMHGQMHESCHAFGVVVEDAQRYILPFYYISKKTIAPSLVTLGRCTNMRMCENVCVNL